MSRPLSRLQQEVLDEFINDVPVVFDTQIGEYFAGRSMMLTVYSSFAQDFRNQMARLRGPLHIPYIRIAKEDADQAFNTFGDGVNRHSVEILSTLAISRYITESGLLDDERETLLSRIASDNNFDVSNLLQLSLDHYSLIERARD